MSKSKTVAIAELLDNLQKENFRLKEYEKFFEKIIKKKFGINSSEIKKLIRNHEKDLSEFETEICQYFNLKTAEDKADFLSIMCNDSSLRYYNGKHEKAAAEQQG